MCRLPWALALAERNRCLMQRKRTQFKTAHRDMNVVLFLLACGVRGLAVTVIQGDVFLVIVL